MARQKKSKAILQAGKENVSIEQTFRGKYRGFAVFLICCALLIAAFAVSSVWMQGDGNGWLDRTAEGESSTDCNGEDINIPTEELNHTEGNTNGQQQTPAGTTPVVDGNLSYLSFG